jgi:hypothetical protein
MVEGHEPVIALLLIRQGLCDANAYGVIRCLERHFGWLHWSEIKQQLLANGHLIQLDQSQVPAYALTAAGKAFSTQFREWALAKVRQDSFAQREHTHWLIDQL